MSGRVLDLGCGTSGCVAYLARHGWDALGVDFSDVAMRKATADAAEVSGAKFAVGDVTRLSEDGITGPFDLVIDSGDELSRQFRWPRSATVSFRSCCRRRRNDRSDSLVLHSIARSSAAAASSRRSSRAKTSARTVWKYT